MANKQASMRSALGRVRAHGASGEGTGHFVGMRVTSVALGLLAPWFVFNVALSVRDGSYVGAIDFLTNPINAVGVILLVVIGLYHMTIGMQEVILDYIHKPFAKFSLLFLNAAIPLVLAVGALFAVLLVNFGV